MTDRFRHALLHTSLACLLCQLARAERIPNAGEILQNVKSSDPVRAESPVPKPESALEPLAKTEAETLTDSQAVLVQHITITGNTVLPAEVLQTITATAEGKLMTLSGLRQLADRITRAYVDRGYLLARAYLPAQVIDQGNVNIAVQEGRLGQLRLNNTSRVSGPFIEQMLANLPYGEVIQTDRIEESLLLVREVPGLQSAATLVTGTAPGTADLLVTTTSTPLVTGSVSLDNSGGDSTGAIRLGSNAALSGLFGRADRLSLQVLSTLASSSYLRYGRVSYDLGIGGRGTRIGSAYSHVNYSLGQNFKALDATGEADVFQVWVDRPWLRHRRYTLDTQVGFDYKNLDDRVKATGSRTPRSLYSGIFELHGTWRDGWRGAYMVGSLRATLTQVDIRDATARAIDAAGADTQGMSGKVEANWERWQVLTPGLMLYLKLGGQYAGCNLDSGDQIGVAGPYGVRAYPQGEAFGDSALFGTAELRYSLPFGTKAGDWEAVMFYDHAKIWLEREPVSPLTDNDRVLGGLGAGLRWNYRDHWSAKVDAAWATQPAALAAGAHTPQVWCSLNYRF